MVLLRGGGGGKSFELHIFPPPFFVCEKNVMVTYLKREAVGLIKHIISHRFHTENSHDHTMVPE